jgi:hypothetical protein
MARASRGDCRVLACAYAGFCIIGWLGVAIFGLLVTLVALQVEMDSAAPIGTAQNTGLFAATMASQAAESRAERAERHAEARARGRVLLFAKAIGSLIAIAGGVGFFVFQLPA